MNKTKRRPFKADAWVHVYKRRKDKFLLFYTVRDFLVYYTQLSCLAKKHNVRVLGVCIMVDHIHELLKADSKTSLANFEKELNSRFALEWNEAHKTSGRVFGRFGSALKIGDKAKRTCISYLANNPVERHLCVRAESYPWNFLLRQPLINDLPDISENMHFLFKRVEALCRSGRFMTYQVLDNLVASLDNNEQKMLTSHIIRTYDMIDRRAVTALYGSEDDMIIAINSNTGSEYDIPESFTGVSDAVYSKMRTELEKKYRVWNPSDVIHWDIDKKIAVVTELMHKCAATLSQAAKYLHLEIVEEETFD